MTEVLATVAEAAGKWRDELHDYVIPGSTAEETKGYTEQADKISAALDQLQPITVYFTGDEEGPDRFGMVYDTEDEALEVASENLLHVWRVPVIPDWAAAEHIESADDDDVNDPDEGDDDE